MTPISDTSIQYVHDNGERFIKEVLTCHKRIPYCSSPKQRELAKKAFFAGEFEACAHILRKWSGRAVFDTKLEIGIFKNAQKRLES